MKRKYAARRATWLNQNEVARPVIGVDIDGTLGRYHEHFINFINGYYDLSADLHGYDGSVSLASYLGVSKARYRRAKLAYRQGGLKRSMPLYPGMAEAVGELRLRGAMVAICTTRPYLSLENIDGDTREWLRRNGIRHDAVIWGEHKYRDLVKAYGRTRIVAVVDDLPSMLAQADGLGLDTVIMRRRHNAGDSVGPTGTVEAHTAQAFRNLMRDKMNEWEARNL